MNYFQLLSGCNSQALSIILNVAKQLLNLIQVIYLIIISYIPPKLFWFNLNLLKLLFTYKVLLNVFFIYI